MCRSILIASYYETAGYSVCPSQGSCKLPGAASTCGARTVSLYFATHFGKETVNTAFDLALTALVHRMQLLLMLHEYTLRSLNGEDGVSVWRVVSVYKRAFGSKQYVAVCLTSRELQYIKQLFTIASLPATKCTGPCY